MGTVVSLVVKVVSVVEKGVSVVEKGVSVVETGVSVVDIDVVVADTDALVVVITACGVSHPTHSIYIKQIIKPTNSFLISLLLF